MAPLSHPPKNAKEHGESGRNYQRIMVDVVIFILPEQVNLNVDGMRAQVTS
jgi:hypothetical protein